jgi:uncharacterized protein YjbI with pentapeptide repeats
VSAVHAPRIEPELRVVPVELDDDADLDEVEVRELTFATDVLHDVRIQRSRLVGVSLAGHRFVDAELRDVHAHTIDAVGARLGKASLTRVEIHDSRLSGLDLGEATLRHVRFVSCRLDGANLRMVDAESVEFEDCELHDVDLGGARLRGVRFAGSRLSAVDFSNARCERVDLRGALLTDPRGVTGLRGATIGVDQVLPLAPAVLADLGITVADDGH